MKWNEYFLNIAKVVATKSKDPSTKIGAIIIEPNSKSILSTGWNGFPRGILDSEERLNNRDIKYTFTVHAEMNAILNAARNGVRLEDSYIYVTAPVCHNCAISIIQVGIKGVIFLENKEMQKRWFESFDLAMQLFKEAEISTYEVRV